MDFAINNGSPDRTPPIPITRGLSTGPMNIPGHFNDRNNNNKTSSKFSQSMPLPRAPIIGSLPAPTSVRFEQMPSLELPPSFKDDEIARSFGAPGTSLGSSHRGYAASCPDPSFMSQASKANRKRRGDGGSGGSDNMTGIQPHARTPSYNTPSMGSRTVLSVLLETDETEYKDENNHSGDASSNGNGNGNGIGNGNGRGAGMGGMGGEQEGGINFTTDMGVPIHLEKLNLKSMDNDDEHFSDDDGLLGDDLDEEDEGLFQMDTE